MRLTDRFSFGKYKGLTLKYVMENKGSYVGWCIENIPNFKIEPEKIHRAFVKSYNEWKNNGFKGMEVHYKSINYLSFDNIQKMKKVSQHFIDKMDEHEELF